MIAGEYLTVAEAAEQLNVSPQRVHALIRFYKVKVEQIAHGKLTLIPKSEFAKIPKKRPSGPRNKKNYK